MIDLHVFLGRSVPEINIIGKSELCPGEVGLYECTVINGRGLRWIVDGQRLHFSGGQMRGDRLDVLNTAIISYLVDVAIISTGVLGNRRSILHYEANFNVTRTITIICDGGRLDAFSMEVVVVGESFFLHSQRKVGEGLL